MADKNYKSSGDNIEYLFRCDCADTHFLHISWWPDDDWDPDLGFEGSFVIEGSFWSTWRTRLRLAWKALTKHHFGSDVGIMLDGEKAADIATAMARFVHDREASKARRETKRAASNGQPGS